MSIYCSFCCLDGEEPGWPAPIIYQESHVLPSDDDPRGGSLDLGAIPPWITRDGKCLAGKPCTLTAEQLDCCEYHHDYAHWPFLRVSLRPAGGLTVAEWRQLTAHTTWLREHCYDRAADADLIDRVADPEDTVVLDRDQVTKLRDALTDWLDSLPEETP